MYPCVFCVWIFYIMPFYTISSFKSKKKKGKKWHTFKLASVISPNNCLLRVMSGEGRGRKASTGKQHYIVLKIKQLQISVQYMQTSKS